MKFVRADLEAAGRDQGRACPAVHAAVLRRALRRPVGAAGAGQGRRARPRPQREASSNSRSRRDMVRRRRTARVAAISPARSRRRARRGARRQPGESGRARPRRLHRRRSRLRSATSPTPCAGCARPASRSSPMRPAIPTTATSLPPPHRRSGSTRLAPCSITGPGGSNLYYKGLLDKLGRDRERLSRRHLQVGGRAVHPQRHVARGEAELHWRSTRPSSKPGGKRIQHGAAQGERRPVPHAT